MLRLVASAACILWCGLANAQTPEQVLVVVNSKSAVSKEIGAYYMQRRGVPAANLCTIKTDPDEMIERMWYEPDIEKPIAACLKKQNLQEKVLYIVLTSGVPLGIQGGGDSLTNDAASVDSELTLLYGRMRGAKIPAEGPYPNPFFTHRNVPFSHPAFPIYLVTRLDGYSIADMKALIDHALAARNKGRFVIDLRDDEMDAGNQWLKAAANALPKDRLLLDETTAVISGTQEVIGYASWGSNDRNRKKRATGFGWLPGAIVADFVSTSARTFRPPPKDWELGTWANKSSHYADSPQSLAADYIHEGATGASGNVFEPYLQYCARPEIVLPAYNAGRNLAESFYAGLPALSWMSVVVGDPLTRLQ